MIKVKKTDENKNWGMDIADVLLSVPQFALKSKSDARRQIEQGAARLADEKIIDPFARLVYYENQFWLIEE